MEVKCKMASDIPSPSTSLTVAIRIRPLLENEIEAECSEVAELNEEEKNAVLLRDIKARSMDTIERLRYRKFNFDLCFGKDTSQEDLYHSVGKDVLSAFLEERKHSTIIAYGQTGSGKTHTMLGSREKPGLIPRLCESVLEKEEGRYSISFYEIYNGRVQDLLAYAPSPLHSPSSPSHTCLQPKKLRVRQDPRIGPFVEGLSRHPLKTIQDIQLVLTLGCRARSTGPTASHEASSRSHAVCSLQETVPESASIIPDHRSPKLHLVDLAGSERAHILATKEQAKESAHINRSLATLGNVILALSARGKDTQALHSKFIPYRDSTLTWLLKNSLGGSAKTVMIGTISPAHTCYSESLSTLRYAHRARNIHSIPLTCSSFHGYRGGRESEERMVLVNNLQKEILKLQRQLHLSRLQQPSIVYNPTFVHSSDRRSCLCYYSPASALRRRTRSAEVLSPRVIPPHSTALQVQCSPVTDARLGSNPVSPSSDAQTSQTTFQDGQNDAQVSFSSQPNLNGSSVDYCDEWQEKIGVLEEKKTDWEENGELSREELLRRIQESEEELAQLKAGRGNTRSPFPTEMDEEMERNEFEDLLEEELSQSTHFIPSNNPQPPLSPLHSSPVHTLERIPEDLFENEDPIERLTQSCSADIFENVAHPERAQQKLEEFSNMDMDDLITSMPEADMHRLRTANELTPTVARTEYGIERRNEPNSTPQEEDKIRLDDGDLEMEFLNSLISGQEKEFPQKRPLEEKENKEENRNEDNVNEHRFYSATHAGETLHDLLELEDENVVDDDFTKSCSFFQFPTEDFRKKRRKKRKNLPTKPTRIAAKLCPPKLEGLSFNFLKKNEGFVSTDVFQEEDFDEIEDRYTKTFAGTGLNGGGGGMFFSESLNASFARHRFDNKELSLNSPLIEETNSKPPVSNKSGRAKLTLTKSLPEAEWRKRKIRRSRIDFSPLAERLYPKHLQDSGRLKFAFLRKSAQCSGDGEEKAETVNGANTDNTANTSEKTESSRSSDALKEQSGPSGEKANDHRTDANSRDKAFTSEDSVEVPLPESLGLSQSFQATFDPLSSSAATAYNSSHSSYRSPYMSEDFTRGLLFSSDNRGDEPRMDIKQKLKIINGEMKSSESPSGSDRPSSAKRRMIRERAEQRRAANTGTSADSSNSEPCEDSDTGYRKGGDRPHKKSGGISKDDSLERLPPIQLYELYNCTTKDRLSVSHSLDMLKQAKLLAETKKKPEDDELSIPSYEGDSFEPSTDDDEQKDTVSDQLLASNLSENSVKPSSARRDSSFLATSLNLNQLLPENRDACELPEEIDLTDNKAFDRDSLNSDSAIQVANKQIYTSELYASRSPDSLERNVAAEEQTFSTEISEEINTKQNRDNHVDNSVTTKNDLTNSDAFSVEEQFCLSAERITSPTANIHFNFSSLSATDAQKEDYDPFWDEPLTPLTATTAATCMSSGKEDTISITTISGIGDIPFDSPSRNAILVNKQPDTISNDTNEDRENLDNITSRTETPKDDLLNSSFSDKCSMENFVVDESKQAEKIFMNKCNGLILLETQRTKAISSSGPVTVDMVAEVKRNTVFSSDMEENLGLNHSVSEDVVINYGNQNAEPIRDQAILEGEAEGNNSNGNTQRGGLLEINEPLSSPPHAPPASLVKPLSVSPPVAAVQEEKKGDEFFDFFQNLDSSVSHNRMNTIKTNEMDHNKNLQQPLLDLTDLSSTSQPAQLHNQQHADRQNNWWTIDFSKQNLGSSLPEKLEPMVDPFEETFVKTLAESREEENESIVTFSRSANSALSDVERESWNTLQPLVFVRSTLNSNDEVNTDEQRKNPEISQSVFEMLDQQNTNFSTHLSSSAVNFTHNIDNQNQIAKSKPEPRRNSWVEPIKVDSTHSTNNINQSDAEIVPSYDEIGKESDSDLPGPAKTEAALRPVNLESHSEVVHFSNISVSSAVMEHFSTSETSSRSFSDSKSSESEEMETEDRSKLYKVERTFQTFAVPGSKLDMVTDYHPLGSGSANREGKQSTGKFSQMYSQEEEEDTRASEDEQMRPPPSTANNPPRVPGNPALDKLYGMLAKVDTISRAESTYSEEEVLNVTVLDGVPHITMQQKKRDTDTVKKQGSELSSGRQNDSQTIATKNLSGYGVNPEIKERREITVPKRTNGDASETTSSEDYAYFFGSDMEDQDENESNKDDRRLSPILRLDMRAEEVFDGNGLKKAHSLEWSQDRLAKSYPPPVREDRAYPYRIAFSTPDLFLNEQDQRDQASGVRQPSARTDDGYTSSSMDDISLHFKARQAKQKMSHGLNSSLDNPAKKAVSWSDLSAGRPLEIGPTTTIDKVNVNDYGAIGLRRTRHRTAAESTTPKPIIKTRQPPAIPPRPKSRFIDSGLGETFTHSPMRRSSGTQTPIKLFPAQETAAAILPMMSTSLSAVAINPWASSSNLVQGRSHGGSTSSVWDPPTPSSTASLSRFHRYQIRKQYNDLRFLVKERDRAVDTLADTECITATLDTAATSPSSAPQWRSVFVSPNTRHYCGQFHQKVEKAKLDLDMRIADIWGQLKNSELDGLTNEERRWISSYSTSAELTLRFKPMPQKAVLSVSNLSEVGSIDTKPAESTKSTDWLEFAALDYHRKLAQLRTSLVGVYRDMETNLSESVSALGLPYRRGLNAETQALNGLLTSSPTVLTSAQSSGFHSLDSPGDFFLHKRSRTANWIRDNSLASPNLLTPHSEMRSTSPTVVPPDTKISESTCQPSTSANAPKDNRIDMEIQRLLNVYKARQSSGKE